MPPYAKEGEAPDDDAVFMAQFAKAQLDNLATGWRRVTQTAAMARFNGAAIQVWSARKLTGGDHDGMVGLADIADRPMHTIERWEVDAGGVLLGVWQLDPKGERHFIDRGRMVFSQDVPLTDAPNGVGLFRHIAEPVRELNLLRKMSRQGFETDLAGIPVIYAPLAELKAKIGKAAYSGGPTYTQADYTAAVNGAVAFVDNHIRTKNTALLFDSGAHKGVDGGPSGPPLYRAELMAAGGQSHEPVLAAMRDVRWEIAIVLGFEDLLVGSDGGGSLAMAKAKAQGAIQLIKGMLNGWAEVVQRDVLRPLWALNGRDPETAPRPSWNRMELEAIAEVLAGVLAPLSAAGITLDRRDALVNAVLTGAGLPGLEDHGDEEPDPDTADRYGLTPRTGKDAADMPEGVEVDEDDVDDEPPAKVGKRRG